MHLGRLLRELVAVCQLHRRLRRLQDSGPEVIQAGNGLRALRNEAGDPVRVVLLQVPHSEALRLDVGGQELQPRSQAGRVWVVESAGVVACGVLKALRLRELQM